MKAYFSHVMTKATSEDRLFQVAVRMWAADAGLEIWDPSEHEKGLASMGEFQAKDWNGLKECDFLLVAWSLHAPESRGLNAEIEWAARALNMPIVVARAPGTIMESWPFTSVMVAPWWGFANNENQFKEILRCLSQWMRKLARTSRSAPASSTTSRTPSSRSRPSRKPATTSTIRVSRSTGTSRSPRMKRTRSSVTYSSGAHATPME